ncbi:MAG: NACHT domain-containing protein [Polyangiaceae bacterium]|nr:NACHT domain-containing protein [Polyangiaceae bacterium]
MTERASISYCCFAGHFFNAQSRSSRAANRRPPAGHERFRPDPVVEGEPGAGKTALLQHVAYVLGSVHTQGVEPPRHALDLAALRGPRPLLPVPVLLQASKLSECLGASDGLGGFLVALESEIEAALGVCPGRDELREGLLAGRYLVLVDSLDEVPDEQGRRRVVAFLAGIAHRGLPSRVVLTTRPSAYLGRVSLSEALPVLYVAQLDPETVAELARRWCAAHGCDEHYEHGLLVALGETASKHGGANLSENPHGAPC